MIWGPIEDLTVRANWGTSFRAPAMTELAERRYISATFVADTVGQQVALFEGGGNPDLKPEESTNQSYGLVFQPTFLPEVLGDFTFTIDRWKIEQEEIVGLLGAQTALALEYLNRVNGGTNPNVVRSAPTADGTACSRPG